MTFYIYTSSKKEFSTWEFCGFSWFVDCRVWSGLTLDLGSLSSIPPHHVIGNSTSVVGIILCL
jgi:hypothetical protein